LYQSTYFIDKTSNTFADNLTAFGLAFVLNGIADGRAKIRLEDHGAAFAIVCEPAIKEGWVENVTFFTGAPFLATIDNATQRKMIKGCAISPSELPEQGETIVDYQAEKQSRVDYFNWLNSISKDDRRKAFLGELPGPTALHSHWDIFRAVNPLALQSYNAVVAEWWRSSEAFSDLLKILLQMTAQTPNTIESAEKAWIKQCKQRGWEKPKTATANQLLNPAQGKGSNNAKAEWRDPNNIKNFWLLEWLKLAGFFSGGFTSTISNSKDRKTYVLMPTRLEWGKHQEVMKKFRKAMAGRATAIQMDIFAALRYTKAFLEHYEEARTEDYSSELFGHSPADLVNGMQTAFYKNLGNAPAVMNLACINLPRWVKLYKGEDLGRLQESLEEHLAVIRGLDETRGDQFALLSDYRDFISANDMDPFFEFTNAYSSFIISQRERGKYVRQFTTTTLEVLFMNSDDQNKNLSQIIQEEGFKNVAYAIRNSTVNPQYRKGHGGKPAVVIRYGLGQQLVRKASYPADFMAELTEFLQLYNAENAQLSEKGRKSFRKNITTADIEAITGLVDRFGSKLVCNMLVAYGYASQKKTSVDQPTEGEDAGNDASDEAVEGEEE
jgi:hypothetical protein